MIIQRTFSKKKRGRGDRTKAVIAGVGTGALGLTAATVGQGYFTKKLEKDRISSEENEALRGKLLDKIREQGTSIIASPSSENSAWVGTPKLALRKLKRGAESGTGISDSALREAQRVASSGRDSIIVGKGRLSDADVLSHEFGHSRYATGRDHAPIANLSHNLAGMSTAGTIIATPIMGAVGYNSGREAARKEARGEKESLWDKTKHIVIPAAISAPLLITEASASRRGIKELKDLGASEDALSASKKSLRRAFGTYAAYSSAPIIAGVTGRAIGKASEKRRIKKKRRERVTSPHRSTIMFN